MPLHWRRWLSPAEHAFRMTSLTAALLSVAAGTLLGNAYWPLGVPPSDALNARLKADNEL